MNKKQKLNRTVQCARCPWKVSTDPSSIPDGYSIEKHRNLSCTIAEPGSLAPLKSVMACHHSAPDEPEYCIGWLWNQLGEGNNLSLRMLMRTYSNASDLKVKGEQHRCFTDTLPKNYKL